MLITHNPAARLASFVEALWYYDGLETIRVHHKERVLPSAGFQVVIGLSAGVGTVGGLRSQSIVIEPAAIQSAMGVVFRPGAACYFFQEPADHFYNQVVPLDAVWGTLARRLINRLREAMTVSAKFQLLEAALLDAMQKRVARRFAAHPSVPHALREFGRVPHIRTVLDIANETGLSRRRFSQVFREQVGMAPKLYCRLVRFRTLVRQIAAGVPVDWADVALAGGYYDQAHMVHEFRDFSGMSPSRYLVAERPYANHVRID